jgi:hypothetical protein
MQRHLKARLVTRVERASEGGMDRERVNDGSWKIPGDIPKQSLETFIVDIRSAPRPYQIYTQFISV